MCIDKKFKDICELIKFYWEFGILLFSTPLGHFLISKITTVHSFKIITNILLFFIILAIISIIKLFQMKAKIEEKFKNEISKIEEENKVLKLKQEEKIVEHDTKIFNESDQLMPESTFYGFINNNLYNGYYNDDEADLLRNFDEYFKNYGNMYINEEIKSCLTCLNNKIDEIYKFIVTHFHILRDGRYKLYPEWNDGELGTKREEYLKQLRELIDQVDPLYKQYRKTIKNELFI